MEIILGCFFLALVMIVETVLPTFSLADHRAISSASVGSCRMPRYAHIGYLAYWQA